MDSASTGTRIRARRIALNTLPLPQSTFKGLLTATATIVFNSRASWWLLLLLLLLLLVMALHESFVERGRCEQRWYPGVYDNLRCRIQPLKRVINIFYAILFLLSQRGWKLAQSCLTLKMRTLETKRLRKKWLGAVVVKWTKMRTRVLATLVRFQSERIWKKLEHMSHK